MELKGYLVIARRWWWLIILGMVLGSAIGYMVAIRTSLVYEAKTTLSIGGFTQNASPTYAEIATSQRLVQSYAERAGRGPILRAAISSLNMEMDWTVLRRRVSSNAIPETQIMEISVRDEDPDIAMRLADAIAQQLILQSPNGTSAAEDEYNKFIQKQLVDLETNIQDGTNQLQDLSKTLELETTIEGIQKRQNEISALQTKINTWRVSYVSLLTIFQENGQGANYLTIIESAVIFSLPSRQIAQTIVIWATVGLGLAFGGIYLIDYLDDTIKTAEDVQRTLNVTTLGTIPKMQLNQENGSGKRQIVTAQAGFSPTAEAYRILRTNLQFSSMLAADPVISFLITSTGIGEGKSTTVANLAVVMAQAGKKVVLVDADMRRPVIHKFFGVSNKVGLTNLLVDSTLELEKILIQTKVDNLRILPTGPLPPNAADVLASKKMGQLVKRIEEQADIVFYDTPPLTVVADASILVTNVKVALMVIEASSTYVDSCMQSKSVLEQVGGSLLGVIINKYDPKLSYFNYKKEQHYYSTENS